MRLALPSLGAGALRGCGGYWAACPALFSNGCADLETAAAGLVSGNTHPPVLLVPPSKGAGSAVGKPPRKASIDTHPEISA